MCRDLFGSPGLGLVTALVNTRRNLFHVLAVGLVHNLNFQGSVAWRKNKIGLHTRIQKQIPTTYLQSLEYASL